MDNLFNLTTNFSFNKPNFVSTAAKNSKGLCCFGECNNKLPVSENYFYMNFRTCKECGKKLKLSEKELKEELKQESDKYIIKQLSDALKIIEAR